jgi:hypothetical protein
MVNRTLTSNHAPTYPHPRAAKTRLCFEPNPMGLLAYRVRSRFDALEDRHPHHLPACARRLSVDRLRARQGNGAVARKVIRAKLPLFERPRRSMSWGPRDATRDATPQASNPSRRSRGRDRAGVPHHRLADALGCGGADFLVAQGPSCLVHEMQSKAGRTHYRIIDRRILPQSVVIGR